MYSQHGNFCIQDPLNLLLGRTRVNMCLSHSWKGSSCVLRCSQWLCPLLAFLPFLTVSIAQLPSSNGSRKNRGNRSGNSLHQLPGLSFPGSIYLLSPAFPCRSLALLPSHLSRSQNNKRLICLPPFDEFLMLQTCVRTSGSLLGAHLGQAFYKVPLAPNGH